MDSQTTIKKGVTLYPNIYLKGKNYLGGNVEILPNCFIQNCCIKDGVKIGANCVLKNLEIDCNIKSFSCIEK